MKKNLFEFRRQIAHIVFGCIIVFIYARFLISPHFLGGLFVIGCCFAMILKTVEIPVLHHFLLLFEREKHFKKFPGRGFVFFMLGAYLSLVFFNLNVALSSIMILTFGDAFTNLIGYYFGKKVHFLNKRKTWEGTIGGIIMGTMAGSLFIPIVQVFLATTISMFFEAPQWKIGRYEIDDNLIIPLVAGCSLVLLNV